MNEVCSVCGLPKEICACETIAKEQQKIHVRLEKKRFGKVATVVEGIDEKQINTKQLAKMLKQRLACGGTYKDNVIELQGDHVSKVKDLLVGMGYSPELIDITK
jgi:translation initiation factor 1